MTKSKKVLLALGTAGPIIVPVIWEVFCRLMSLILPKGHSSTVIQTTFLVFGGIHMLLFLGLYTYYIAHVLLNERLKEKTLERTLWLLFIVITGPIGEAVYWYRYIWKDQGLPGRLDVSAVLLPRPSSTGSTSPDHQRTYETCIQNAMTRRKKLLLASVTAGPVICFAILVSCMVFLVLVRHISPDNPPIALIVIHGICMLVALGLSIYYIIHVMRNKKFQDKGTERIFWVLVILICATIGQAVYWYQYIWKDNDIGNAELRPA